MSGPTVVLVHGAWHGSWCWDAVVALLQQRGIAAVAVDLPGHGDDVRPLGDLHADAAAVTDVLDRTEGEVVLVGHSYGGVVVTEAAAHPRVGHVVYIAAFNVAEGESANAAAVDEPDIANVDHSGRPSAAEHLRKLDDGSYVVDSDGAKLLFYNDCSDEVATWATSRLTPQRMGNLYQTPDRVAWRDRPSTYVICSADNAVHPDLQRILARRAGEQVEWPTGHSPFLSRPELVVDLLTRLASLA